MANWSERDELRVPCQREGSGWAESEYWRPVVVMSIVGSSAKMETCWRGKERKVVGDDIGVKSPVSVQMTGVMGTGSCWQSCW